MIRNGLYLIELEALDRGVGGYRGVVVLRDGSILGGGSFFYFIGNYSCSAGRWKGELTSAGTHAGSPYGPDSGTNCHRRIYRNLYRRECRVRSHGARGQEKPSIPCKHAAAGSRLTQGVHAAMLGANVFTDVANQANGRALALIRHGAMSDLSSGMRSQERTSTSCYCWWPGFDFNRQPGNIISRRPAD